MLRPGVSRPDRAGTGRGHPDAGYITAETATVLPALVFFLAVLVWGLMASAAQIQCVDAARAGARAAARSEPEGQVLAAARQAAPRGARVRSFRDGEFVRVEVTAQALGPGRLAALLSVQVGAAAQALAEDTVGDPG